MSHRVLETADGKKKVYALPALGYFSFIKAIW